jgi:hypothetical protein
MRTQLCCKQALILVGIGRRALWSRVQCDLVVLRAASHGLNASQPFEGDAMVQWCCRTFVAKRARHVLPGVDCI